MPDTALPPGVPPAGDPVALPNTAPAPAPTTSPAPAPAPAGTDLLGLNAPTPAPAPAPAPEPTSVPELSDVDLMTGDPALDVNVRLFTQLTGAKASDFERAIGNAVRYGDESLIDAAFIRERFGDKADMATELAKAYLAGVTTRAQSAVQSVYALAGGEAAWGVARDAFNSIAPEHVKVAARALADSGRATDAAKLVLDYARQSGAVVTQGNLLQGGGSGLVGQALTAAEFSTEYKKLREQYKGRSLEQGPAKAAYDDLLRRREQGRKLGR